MSLDPQTQLDHYEILARLGAGGMGEVYRARDLRLGRELAIKMLPPELALDRDLLARFEKEARIASALNHPNIITVYDIGRFESTPYIALELVDGRTLRECMAAGPMPVAGIIDLAEQIADGLAKAHEAGIVHRDLKPENIMVTKDGLVKILDFGLGKTATASLPVDSSSSASTVMAATNPGTILGTIEYMSPEQAAGQDVDFRSDQFSLGSLLYEMTTGTKPFHRGSAVQTLSAIIEDPPPAIQSLSSAVSGPFFRIVERCLEKNPQNRYSTTRELLGELRAQSALLHVSGLGLAPATPAGRRLRPVTIVGAAAIAVLAGLLAVTLPADWFRRLVIAPPDSATAIPEKKNVVLLPFRVAGQHPLIQIFANGLTESVTGKLTYLTILPSLQVAPATEIRTRQIDSVEEARLTVGANLVVAGSIEPVEGTLRVNCSLFDASTGRQVDVRTISAPASDMLTVQDQTVAAIIQMLGLELKPEERAVLETRDTVVSAAKEAFLQARGYFQDFDKAENVDRAIALLQESLRLDPNYAAAAAGLGEAYWRKFEATKESRWLTAAQKACGQALTLNDKLAAGHGCLATVYTATGRYPEAVTEFERAVNIEPTNDGFYRELARAQELSNEIDEAEETHKRAITLRPHYWANYNRLGAFYYERGRYDDAVRMFQQAVALAPDSVFGYVNLGGAYVQLGRYGDAIPMFERSAKIRPTATVYSNLATAYFGRRRFLEAAQTFEQAVKLNEKNHTIWGNLGEAYYWAPGKRPQATGAYRRAISLGEERLKVNPRDVTVLSQVASYHAMTGQKQAAMNLIERALALSPSDPGVRYKAAIIHNQFNEVDKTFEWLEKAVQAGYSSTTIRDAPNFDGLWANVRFQQLLRGK